MNPFQVHFLCHHLLKIPLSDNQPNLYNSQRSNQPAIACSQTLSSSCYTRRSVQPSAPSPTVTLFSRRVPRVCCWRAQFRTGFCVFGRRCFQQLWARSFVSFWICGTCCSFCCCSLGFGGEVVGGLFVG